MTCGAIGASLDRLGATTGVRGHHGLPHDPYTAFVGPRSIGWIGSMNLKGVGRMTQRVRTWPKPTPHLPAAPPNAA
jgi:hypothetical protein